MGSIRTRPENGLLFMDFKFQGLRLREQTTLPDSSANRKRLQKALDRIEAELTKSIPLDSPTRALFSIAA